MTKNEILASILPLASKEGLRNLSLSKIAENAGIAKSTLYSHFDSKDDMIDQLYLFLREKAKERMNTGVVDYGKIVKGKSLEEVLLYVVSSYDSINRDRDMKNFYAIIESEKAFSNIAARIITEETETIDGLTDHWLKIEYASNKYGWIFGGYASVERGGPKYYIPEAMIIFDLSWY